MPLPLQPNIWFELNLALYPATEGTTVYRWAFQPLADAGQFKEGRLISVSPCSRTSSDIDGNFTPGKATVVVDDSDGLIRGLLEHGTTSEYFANREAGIYLLSPAGRAAALTPRTIFRGWVSDVQTLKHRQVRIEIADVVGSQFSGFNLDKTIPSVVLQDLSANVPQATQNQVLPIYTGEHSDKGAVDTLGNSAEKGLIPVWDLGYVDITGGSAVAQYLQPPVNLRATIVGAGGGATYYYQVTAGNAQGETNPSVVLVVTGAPGENELSTSNYVKLEWDDADIFSGSNVTFFRVLGRRTSPASGWLDGMNNGGTYVNPEHEYHDDGDDLFPDQLPALGINTAQGNGDVWAMMAICLGYSYTIIDIFASDLADGVAPKRRRMTEDEHEAEIITPDDASWPHADPWIEVNGIRLTGFYMRGPRLAHHRSGAVTVAVNLCGPHDGVGLLIDQAFKQLLFVLNEHVAKNHGTGYREGAYWPLEEYDNGDSILQTSKFLACQDKTIDWIGDVGYLGAISIAEPMTAREILRRAALSFGCRWASNHHGQFFPILIEPGDIPAGARALREKTEIQEIDDPTLAHGEVLNRSISHYQWDTDGRKFRARNILTENSGSIAAHTPGGVSGGTDRRGVRSEDRQMFYTADPATAADVIAKEMGRRARRPRYFPVHVNLMGLEHDVDTPVMVTHSDGLGVDGDVAMPGLILEHEVDANDGSVRLLVQDLRTMAL